MGVETLKALLDNEAARARELETGEAAEALGCMKVTVLAVTDDGRLYQVSGGMLSGGELHLCRNPVAIAEELMQIVLRKG